MLDMKESPWRVWAVAFQNTWRDRCGWLSLPSAAFNSSSHSMCGCMRAEGDEVEQELPAPVSVSGPELPPVAEVHRLKPEHLWGEDLLLRPLPAKDVSPPGSRFACGFFYSKTKSQAQVGVWIPIQNGQPNISECPSGWVVTFCLLGCGSSLSPDLCSLFKPSILSGTEVHYMWYNTFFFATEQLSKDKGTVYWASIYSRACDQSRKDIAIFTFKRLCKMRTSILHPSSRWWKQDFKLALDELSEHPSWVPEHEGVPPKQSSR